MRSNYKNRIRAATWVSALLHLALLALAWWFRPAFTLGPSQSEIPPITITFAPSPPAPEAPPLNRQLIDVAMPATQPVRPTDLIATENSNARDTVAIPGAQPGPKVEEEAPVDSLGGKAGSTPSAESPPTPEPPNQTQDTSPTPEDPVPPAPAEPPKPETPQNTAAATPAPAAMQVARADPPPASPQAAAPPTPTPKEAPTGNNRLADAPLRGRTYGGVQHTGVKGFEALQDEIAPYLKKVQTAVELNWREAMLTKYNGAKATFATVDCEIGPDGKIVSLKFFGVPEDSAYAALCKEAIAKAGPFGAFPFVVPEIYRNRNLEIRWSFKFL